MIVTIMISMSCVVIPLKTNTIVPSCLLIANMFALTIPIHFLIITSIIFIVITTSIATLESIL